ncbi:hypothetical protein HGRIS_001283 [Hohenbuehelia grisea]|uniref:Uncharacterized protein n=1 Tax=Hohenbuehelia grisea TaxID=104357 RepID=A0ABR3JQR4_9AGAR
MCASSRRALRRVQELALDADDFRSSLSAGTASTSNKRAAPPSTRQQDPPASNTSQNKGVFSLKANLPSVKQEPCEFGITRRSSASSTGDASDDSLSVYSAGSAPSRSFNSPNVPYSPLAPPPETLLAPAESVYKI